MPILALVREQLSPPSSTAFSISRHFWALWPHARLMQLFFIICGHFDYGCVESSAWSHCKGEEKPAMKWSFLTKAENKDLKLFLLSAFVQAKWFMTREVPTANFAETNANLSTQFEGFCNLEFNDLLWSQGFHVSKWPASNEHKGEHGKAFRQPLRDCFTMEELPTRPSNQQISNLDRILTNTEKKRTEECGQYHLQQKVS